MDHLISDDCIEKEYLHFQEEGIEGSSRLMIAVLGTRDGLNLSFSNRPICIIYDECVVMFFYKDHQWYVASLSFNTNFSTKVILKIKESEKDDLSVHTLITLQPQLPLFVNKSPINIKDCLFIKLINESISDDSEIFFRNLLFREQV